MTTLWACRTCGEDLPYRGRGRPRTQCSSCRQDEIAEKQRAYREANKDEIAEKQRAKLTCVVCGERLWHPVADGMCWFCREELTANAA